MSNATTLATVERRATVRLWLVFVHTFLAAAPLDSVGSDKSTGLQVEHGNSIKAWEQQADESSLAYRYFQAFLGIGPQRSIRDAVDVLLADPLIKKAPNATTISEYHRLNRWAYRAELWDRHEFANQARLNAEQRRTEMRISIEEYQRVQHQMSKGLASLASKVLRKVTQAVDRLPDSEWNLDRSSRFMATLNSTAMTASGLWNESLGVGKLVAALEEMDASASEESAAFLAQAGPPPVKEPA